MLTNLVDSETVLLQPVDSEQPSVLVVRARSTFRSKGKSQQSCHSQPPPFSLQLASAQRGEGDGAADPGDDAGTQAAVCIEAIPIANNPSVLQQSEAHFRVLTKVRLWQFVKLG
jgi:hypothetical protein